MSAVPHLRSEPKPPPGVTFRDIDPESGMLWQDGCPGPLREVFLAGTAPTHSCPRGFFGNLVRRVLFDREHFDEPPPSPSNSSASGPTKWTATARPWKAPSTA